ncbi:CPBP family intramembrane glutamic endopeptidase [Blautia sp. XA-2221]|uniref:CPBP family intramembrane glutamic endopeptidase n=1 Tax=Blautia sp. XA-2221 TaxID=2903961 RepID=UPI002378966C|nr:type II CAAX endopeptidase family protein [Blautia sp. XA-2221]
MKFTQTEKKQLMIYVIIAYGITYALGLLMWYGYGKGIDLSAFPNAQMLYPAAGVMMAYLITRKDDKKLPKAFYIFFVVLTAVMIFCAAASVLFPVNIDIMGAPFSQWMLLLQYAMMGGSIVFWILLLASGKEKRRAYGLNSNQWNTSVLMILLFIGLYLLRFVIASALGGQLSEFGKIMVNPNTWIMFFTVLINFFTVVVAFFGEEYGWRYYLQPLFQKRFGLKGGVILLGCVWAVWHLPIDFFYYTTPDMGLAALVSQFITCITLGLFMAYAYMKTQNIWVPVIIHFLNNNMAVVFSGTYSADVLQNQQIHWGEIPVALVLNLLIFGWVIFLKPFKENNNLQ